MQMQFSFRIDDNNYITYKLEVSPASASSDGLGPEIVSAVVADSKLSVVKVDDIVDIAGQLVDHLQGPAPGNASVADEDWRQLFREGKL